MRHKVILRTYTTEHQQLRQRPETPDWAYPSTRNIQVHKDEDQEPPFKAAGWSFLTWATLR